MATRNHLRFLARTVLVRNNDVDKSYRTLDRVLRSEKVLEEYRRRQFQERPYERRNRLSYERCKRIYMNEMQRKIEFIMRKNRIEPFPR